MSISSTIFVSDRQETEVGRRRWRRSARFLVGASLAWLVFVVVLVTLAERLWPLQMLELAPPVIFLAVPLLLLSGIPLLRLLRRRVPRSAKLWIVLTLVASIAVSAGRTDINIQALSAKPAVPTGAVRVVAWNTEYWDQFDEGGLDRLYSFLHGQQADIYMLSEHVAFSGRYIRYPLDDRTRLQQAFPNFHMASVGELLTMSKYPIVSSRPVGTTRGIPRERSGWTEFWSEKALRTDLLVNGRILSVYNLHVPVQVRADMTPIIGPFWSWLKEALPWRQDQYRALERDIRANPNPVLVAGDFNASPASMGFNWRGQGLHDAMGAGGPLYPVSWPEKSSTFSFPRLWRLDWTFVSPGVRVYRYAFHSSRDADARDPNKKWRALSDHRTQNLLITVGKR